jgi:hypothetical protein
MNPVNPANPVNRVTCIYMIFRIYRILQKQKVRQGLLPVAPCAPPSCSQTYSLAVVRLSRTPPFVVVALTVGPPDPRLSAICFEMRP